jgi:hypothetical protein
MFSQLVSSSILDEMIMTISGGQMFFGDLEVLYEVSKNKDLVVELGTARGLSSIILASHVNKVVTIDSYKFLDLGIEEQKLTKRESNRIYKIVKNYLRLGRNIESIKSDSVEASKDFEDESIDLLYIDANHTYKGVKSDFYSWFSKVKIGGFILFHDYSSTYKGIKRFIDIDLYDNEEVEIINFKTLGHTVMKIFKKIEKKDTLLSRLRKGDYKGSTAECFIHKKKETAFILIQKCATKSMMKSLRSAKLTKVASFFNSIDYENYEVAAIIRNPIDRWISGFATWLAIKEHNGEASYDELLSIFDNEDEINYIIKQVAFDVHTRPQVNFIEPVLSKIKLFDITQVEKVFKWLKSKGIKAQNIHIHRTGDFAEDSIHRVAYNKTKKLIEDNEELYNSVVNYYKEDFRLCNKLVENK